MADISKDIFIKTYNRDLVKLEIDEVYFFTKINGKVIAVLKDRNIEIETSLFYINETLCRKYLFFRCHKSFIINLTKIESISKFHNKTYNIMFKGIKNEAFITQKNLKVLLGKISVL